MSLQESFDNVFIMDAVEARACLAAVRSIDQRSAEMMSGVGMEERTFGVVVFQGARCLARALMEKLEARIPRLVALSGGGQAEDICLALTPHERQFLVECLLFRVREGDRFDEVGRPVIDLIERRLERRRLRPKHPY